MNSRHLQSAIESGQSVEVYQAMNALTDSVSNSADFVEYAFYLIDNFHWFCREGGAIQEDVFVERLAGEVRERIGLAEIQANHLDIEWSVLAQVLYSSLLRE